MKDIALVLGGGGARGIAHLNVIEALDDLGLRPSIIVGTSIGAIIGAGYAAGLTGSQMREFALTTFGNRNEVMSRLWRLRPDSLQSIFTKPPRLGELNAQRVLKAFLPEEIPEEFESLQIPLKVTATDFYGNSTTIIESGPLWPALAASAAIPAVFRPEMIGGRVHVDGGMSNPVAFDLVDSSTHFVIAVDVVGSPTGDPARIPTRIEAAFGASQLMMQALTQFKLKLHEPHLLIRPEVNEFRVMDFLHTEAILERTAETRVTVRKSLENLLEGIASKPLAENSTAAT